jgi:hypothetical protein
VDFSCFLLPLAYGKLDVGPLPITPKATPAVLGNWKEQQIQPTRNMDKVKNRFSLICEFWKLASGKLAVWQPVLGLLKVLSDPKKKMHARHWLGAVVICLP